LIIVDFPEFGQPWRTNPIRTATAAVTEVTLDLL